MLNATCLSTFNSIWIAEDARYIDVYNRVVMITKIKKFFTEVVVELKKVSWSTRRELIESTKVVLISTAFLGIFIAVVDVVISKFIGVIIN